MGSLRCKVRTGNSPTENLLFYCIIPSKKQQPSCFVVALGALHGRKGLVLTVNRMRLLPQVVDTGGNGKVLERRAVCHVDLSGVP